MPTPSLLPWLLTAIALPLLSACTTPKYACGVPNGIGCKPLSEVHRLAQSGALQVHAAPYNREASSTKKPTTPRSDVERLARFGEDADAESSEAIPTEPLPEAPKATTPPTNDPVMLPPRTLRVWLARWSDTDGTLHDASYLHLKLDNGRWAEE